uniref:Uncharacterized protein n=1 Tax=Talaromyces marneffei PM1 TaxID=1077442 RepID=A0A093VBY8_TALMA
MQRAPARQGHSYEKRPRRRTKADRYEPYKEISVSEQGSPRPKHSQNNVTVIKRNDSRLAQKFCAKNVRTGRLTLTSNENLGIFKKGKTSSPVSCVKVSYPNFSELQFLAKDPQAAIPEEEVQASLYSEKHGLKSNAGSTDALIEGELFKVLSDCHELSVPYEEYVPRYPNSRFISFQNLKDLCMETDNMWSARKEKHVFDHAIGDDIQSLNDAPSCYTRIEDAYYTTPERNAAKKSRQREDMFDMLLELAGNFDEDVQLKVLAELVEPCADGYELQAAGRTNYPHDMEDIDSNYAYNVPHMLEEGCGGSTTMKQGGHWASSNTAQRRYDDSMVPIGYNIRDYRGMEKGARVKVSTLGISSILDDRQFQFPQTPTPTLTTTHIPVYAAAQNQQTNTTPFRHFWRCNKLY